MAELLGNRLFTALDADGKPISGARLSFFLAGTTTPAGVYEDAALTIPHATPVLCDSAGRAPDIYFDPAVLLKVDIKDAGDVAVRTIDPFNSAFAASDLPFTQSGSGASNRTVLDKLRERVSVTDYGDAVSLGYVVGSGGDDTAAVQAAINQCLSVGSCALIVPVRCLLSTSVNIDRLVDTTTADFHVIGEGPNAGFSCTSAITMFSTSLTYVAAPVSERVVFHNVQFQCSAAATTAYVVSQKMLRITFDMCRFHKIKCATSTNYLQSFHFRDCYANRHTGYFLSATTFIFDLMADVNMEGSGVEQGFSASTFNGAEIAGVYEGILGPILNGPANGLKYRVRYSEGNTNADVDLKHTSALSYGIHFEGGLIFLSTANAANPAFYPIILGDAKAITVSGLYSGKNLFDDTYVPFGELTGTAFSDNSGNVTKTGRPIRAYPLGGLPRSVAITAHAGGGSASAVQLSEGLSVIANCATSADSVGLPTCSLDPIGSASRVCVIRNDGVASAQVYAAVADIANFGGACTIDGINGQTTGVAIPPKAGRIFYTTGLGTWVSLRAEGTLEGLATYDPPNLADGAGATTSVTVTGAVPGDFAFASFSLDLQGINVTAYVSSANTVSVRLQNESGGALDLASGTLRARVLKQ